jgi:hypothetical protein
MQAHKYVVHQHYEYRLMAQADTSDKLVVAHTVSEFTVFCAILEDSLPCSTDPVSVLNPEPADSVLHPHTVFNGHFNIILFLRNWIIYPRVIRTTINEMADFWVAVLCELIEIFRRLSPHHREKLKSDLTVNKL